MCGILPTMGETDIFSNFIKGDDKSFSSLYDLYWKDLFGYAARIMQDKDLAADVVQEVFARLWENRKDLKDIDAIKPYLYKWARNSALNQFREQNIQEKHLEAFQSLFERNGVENTLQEVLDADMRNHIKQSMERLPEKMREIFYLKIFEQLTVKEIAEKLMISEQTVRNQINMASQRMKHIIACVLVLLIK